MRKEISPNYSYIESVLPAESDLKKQARLSSAELGLSAISVSQTEAHLIQFLGASVNPKKIVEIGTLTGLSALYFLELLPKDGKLWTFEKSPLHIEKSKQNLQKYILAGQCEIIEGDALLNLPKISGDGPFDLIFIDGNKAAYYDYFKWAEKNISAGGMMIIDNVFLAGAVWGDQTLQKFNDKQISGMKKMTAEIFSSKHFQASFIPTAEGLLVLSKKDN
jgi:predicted O-methyltransferase YrrM